MNYNFYIGGKIMNRFILMILLVFFALSSTCFAVSFTDLDSNHWAYLPVNEMAEKGILKGYPDGSFMPNKSVTRAEFTKILVLALNLNIISSVSIYEDVTPSHWANDYIISTSQYMPNFVDGSKLYFKPDEPAIREDIAVAVVKASGLENSTYNISALDGIKDKNDISDNLKKYIAIAIENKLMVGNNEGYFNPKGQLTRAQVCQLMINTLSRLQTTVNVDISNSNENVIEESTPILSASIDDGGSINKYDSITLSAKNTNYVDSLGGRTLMYDFVYNGQTLRVDSFKDGDVLVISDVVSDAPDLDGKIFNLRLYYSNSENNEKEYLNTYNYKYFYEEESKKNTKASNLGLPVLSSNLKTGSTLRWYDSITLSVKDTENVLADKFITYSFECDKNILKTGSYKDKLVIKVTDLLNEAKKYDVKMDSKGIKLNLYYDNVETNKKDYAVTYSYKYTENVETGNEIFASSSVKFPKLTSSKEDGSILKWHEAIKLYAKDTEDYEALGDRELKYSIEVGTKVIKSDTYKDGDRVEVNDIIEEAKKLKVNYEKNGIKLNLYYENKLNSKIKTYLVTYSYKILEF